MCSRVDLPAPDGPTKRHHLARPQRQIDAVEHRELGPALVEDPAHPAQFERQTRHHS